MPLDHVKGEVIGDLGHVYRAAPNTKWREHQLFEEAATIAAETFHAMGALLPITFDDGEVLVQEYPRTNALVFVFCKSIARTEQIVVRKYDIPDDMMRELRAQGRWLPMPPFN